MRTTYTMAELEVSKAAYTEIADKLKAAGYDHAFGEDGMIDMKGIGLTAEPDKPAEPQTMLSGGGQVTQDHRELKANGQQKGYVVLTPQERAKGFVRPVRHAYKHVGAPATKNPLRDLTDEESSRYAGLGYVKFEAYPEDRAPVLGRYWTQQQLDAIGKGCGTVTRMANDLSETYARDPSFYSGTFCCGCRSHKPVDEFVWEGTEDRVGS